MDIKRLLSPPPALSCATATQSRTPLMALQAELADVSAPAGCTTPSPISRKVVIGPLPAIQKTKTKKKRVRRYRKLTLEQLQSSSRTESAASRVHNLTLDIFALKQQVRDAMVYKTLRETRVFVDRLNFKSGVLRTLQQHFQLLRTGIREWEPHELDFFHNTTSDSVVVCEAPGDLNAIFSAWGMFREAIQMRRLTLRGMRTIVVDTGAAASADGTCGIIECDCEIEGSVTPDLLAFFFPHVRLRDPVLYQKVVGKRLVYASTIRIHVNAAGRIIKYNGTADMVAGFARIPTLSIHDVSTILANSMLDASACLSVSINEWNAYRRGERSNNDDASGQRR